MDSTTLRLALDDQIRHAGDVQLGRHTTWGRAGALLEIGEVRIVVASRRTGSRRTYGDSGRSARARRSTRRISRQPADHGKRWGKEIPSGLISNSTHRGFRRSPKSSRFSETTKLLTIPCRVGASDRSPVRPCFVVRETPRAPSSRTPAHVVTRIGYRGSACWELRHALRGVEQRIRGVPPIHRGWLG